MVGHEKLCPTSGDTMINQTTLDYLKSRVVSAIPKTSGEITTNSVITFDNGVTVEGSSVRDIAQYDKTEADSAAFQNAVASLIPGIEFATNKVV